MPINFENYHYQMDSRVGARDLWIGYSAEAKTLTRTVYEDDGSEEEVAFPATLVVCSMCEGTATVVNPSIDAGGLSGSDLEDGEFVSSYFRGHYDIACPSCSGQRVVPVIDEKACGDELKDALERLRRQEEEEAACEAASRYERAMGA